VQNGAVFPGLLVLRVLASSLAVFALGAWMAQGGALSITLALLAAAGVLVLSARPGSWLPVLRRQAELTSAGLDALTAGSPRLWIFLSAAIGLVVELLLIRWHSSTFQVFSYYKNVSLLAAFLGLGIGYACARRANLLALGLPLVAVQVIALRILSHTPVQSMLQSPIREQLGLGLSESMTLGHALLTYGLLAAVFLVTVLTCLPFGQLAGRCLLALPPLRAYGWNLAGSLAAVGLFAALSEAWTPPAVWLVTLAVLVLPFLGVAAGRAWPLAVVSLALAIGALSIPHALNAVEYYSPYQAVTLRVRPVASFIESNHSYFQQIWDLRPVLRKDPGLAPVLAYYDLPYRFQPSPGHVLIVGSGAGNDVAAALRNGAGRVDAVEIDPLILHLGEQLHPERPYADPRVRRVVNDARAFIRHTRERYDLIAYGLLDSHTVLSGASSVRLDSYVYTTEALKEARARLAPDGVLTMSFTLLSREIAWKLFLMLREAFGEDPRAFETIYDGGITFVAGPGVQRAAPALPFKDVTNAMRAAGVRADPSTDDWPFLYMAERRFPRSYLVMAAVLLGLSWLSIASFQGRPLAAFSAPAFALGAGFMLVETKAITELALVFGSTWFVTTIVIAGVLVMAWLANLWVESRAVSERVAYPLLLVAVAVSAGWRLFGIELDSGAERLAATALATVPLFFSGLAFSIELKRRQDAAAVLSSNLLGAMLGGLLEYNAMYVGISGLGVLALAVYAGAWGASLVSGRRPA
jgi:SAM-dependent methyltransferase